MKILIASDLHGSKNAAQKLVFLDEKYNFKKIILLGDIGYSGARNVPPSDYYPIDVYKALEKIKNKLIMIKGNCDSRVDETVLNLHYFNKKEVAIDGYHFILTHGDLFNEDSFTFKDNDIFCYGHTHVYILEKHDNHYCVNPGSTTLPKVNKEKTYVIFDTDKKVMTLYDLDENIIKSLKVE